MNLDEDSEGKLFQLCLDIWEKTGKDPSVRLNAFKMIVKIAEKHYYLSKEVMFLIQDQYLDSFSPKAKMAVLKLVEDLQK